MKQIFYLTQVLYFNTVVVIVATISIIIISYF